MPRRRCSTRDRRRRPDPHARVLRPFARESRRARRRLPRARRRERRSESPRTRLDGPTLRPEEVPAVTFAAVVLSREVVDKLAGFDEDYSYCYDDVDFCLRAREAHFSVASCPGAVVWHTSAQTRGDNTAPNLDVYKRKWPPERVNEVLGR